MADRYGNSAAGNSNSAASGNSATQRQRQGPFLKDFAKQSLRPAESLHGSPLQPHEFPGFHNHPGERPGFHSHPGERHVVELVSRDPTGDVLGNAGDDAGGGGGGGSGGSGGGGCQAENRGGPLSDRGAHHPGRGGHDRGGFRESQQTRGPGPSAHAVHSAFAPRGTGPSRDPRGPFSQHVAADHFRAHSSPVDYALGGSVYAELPGAAARGAVSGHRRNGSAQLISTAQTSEIMRENFGHPMAREQNFGTTAISRDYAGATSGMPSVCGQLPRGPHRSSTSGAAGSIRFGGGLSESLGESSGLPTNAPENRAAGPERRGPPADRTADRRGSGFRRDEEKEESVARRTISGELASRPVFSEAGSAERNLTEHDEVATHDDVCRRQNVGARADEDIARACGRRASVAGGGGAGERGGRTMQTTQMQRDHERMATAAQPILGSSAEYEKDVVEDEKSARFRVAPSQFPRQGRVSEVFFAGAGAGGRNSGRNSGNTFPGFGAEAHFQCESNAGSRPWSGVVSDSQGLGVASSSVCGETKSLERGSLEGPAKEKGDYSEDGTLAAVFAAPKTALSSSSRGDRGPSTDEDTSSRQLVVPAITGAAYDPPIARDLPVATGVSGVAVVSGSVTRSLSESGGQPRCEEAGGAETGLGPCTGDRGLCSSARVYPQERAHVFSGDSGGVLASLVADVARENNVARELTRGPGDDSPPMRVDSVSGVSPVSGERGVNALRKPQEMARAGEALKICSGGVSDGKPGSNPTSDDVVVVVEGD